MCEQLSLVAGEIVRLRSLASQANVTDYRTAYLNALEDVQDYMTDELEFDFEEINGGDAK